jgi:hypothetical protein
MSRGYDVHLPQYAHPVGGLRCAALRRSPGHDVVPIETTSLDGEAYSIVDPFEAKSVNYLQVPVNESMVAPVTLTKSPA